jgi:hypothetical protein
LYFSRWPAQEANFRAVSQATGSKDVHGYGKRLVDNISVLNKLDTLAGTVRRAETRATKQTRQVVAAWDKWKEQERLLGRKQRRAVTVREKLATQVIPGTTVTPKTQALVTEQGDLARQIGLLGETVDSHQREHEAEASRLEQTAEKLRGYRAQEEKLQGRRRIFAHDVELDSLFSVLKVGLVLLVSWVLKELLGDARMEVSTFLERVAVLPARVRRMPKLEIVTFEHNHRDPEVTGLLRAHCEAINGLKLKLRNGKTLRIAVDPPPKPRRPPPPGSRVGSGDRFKR